MFNTITNQIEIANWLLTFCLVQFYYAYRVVIRFGEYYRPGQLAFYKSSDYGQTYEPWHYFVSDGDECQEKFGVPFQSNPVTVKQVLCMVYPTESVESNDNVRTKIIFVKNL